MKLFVSYSSKDREPVRALVQDLERARHTVWLDQELRGGDPWWQDILRQIRDCDVFLFAVSSNSLGSKPCRAELGYAQALGIPVLPVQIGPVENLRTATISEIQILDYRDRTATSGIALMGAVQDSEAQRRPLPDPMPEPPAVPFEYLLRLGSASRRRRSARTSRPELIQELKDCLETEDDEGVRDDARGLLRSLRRRSDITYRNASEIDGILGQGATATAATEPRVAASVAGSAGAQPESGTAPTPANRPAAGWYPDQQGNQRYWDGERWTEHITGPPAPAVHASGPTSTSAAGDQTSNGLSIAAFVCGGIAVLFFPIIFGPIAIICAGLAKGRNERLANAALAVAIGGTVLGFILGYAVASNM